MDVELDKLANLECEIGGFRLGVALLVFSYLLSCSAVALNEKLRDKKKK